ncbi:hypothetical protein B0H14DRAFT_3448541 [Mycena olivaceomarginata]|nr:hypothetical protein B0H14DRAFT_3448541 [Mycena olivaceomarginata]
MKIQVKIKMKKTTTTLRNLSYTYYLGRPPARATASTSPLLPSSCDGGLLPRRSDSDNGGAWIPYRWTVVTSEHSHLGGVILPGRLDETRRSSLFGDDPVLLSTLSSLSLRMTTTTTTPSFQV